MCYCTPTIRTLCCGEKCHALLPPKATCPWHPRIRVETVSETELLQLLRETYQRVPENRKGITSIVDFDPAGNTYEFTEYEWSKKVREILKIIYEPTGL